jgi:hypothetical protein
MCETGTGQQVVQLHDSYMMMMMMMMCFNTTKLSKSLSLTATLIEDYGYKF